MIKKSFEMNDVEKEVVILSTKIKMQDELIKEIKKEHKDDIQENRDEIKRHYVELTNKLEKGINDILIKQEKNNDENKIFLNQLQKDMNLSLLKIENSNDKTNHKVDELLEHKQKVNSSFNTVKFIISSFVGVILVFIVSLFQFFK